MKIAQSKFMLFCVSIIKQVIKLKGEAWLKSGNSSIHASKSQMASWLPISWLDHSIPNKRPMVAYQFYFCSLRTFKSEYQWWMMKPWFMKTKNFTNWYLIVLWSFIGKWTACTCFCKLCDLLSFLSCPRFGQTLAQSIPWPYMLNTEAFQLKKDLLKMEVEVVAKQFGDKFIKLLAPFLKLDQFLY